MLLKDMIIAILKEGKAVTPGGLARRCGVCKVRVRDLLVEMTDAKLCRYRMKHGYPKFFPNLVNLYKMPRDNNETNDQR
jgi:hypothetical protein